MSGWRREAEWQERQFELALCQPGFGGATACPGVLLWQTAQPVAGWEGTWQLVQWLFRGAFQPAVWDIGDVDSWQRLQESDVWQVWQRLRSTPAAMQCPLSLQKAVWSFGDRVWWQAVQASRWWHIEQSLAVASSRPSREQAPCRSVQSCEWFAGGVVRSSRLWQVAQAFFAGASFSWQAVQESIR